MAAPQGAYVAVKGPSNGLAIKPKLRPWRPQGVDGVVEETASSTFSSRVRLAPPCSAIFYMLGIQSGLMYGSADNIHP